MCRVVLTVLWIGRGRPHGVEIHVQEDMCRVGPHVVEIHV
jgi:hypothetical protein